MGARLGKKERKDEMIKLIGKGSYKERLELEIHPNNVRLEDGSLPYIIKYRDSYFANSSPNNTHPSDRTGTVHYWESDVKDMTPHE